jgi:hypothetical protein
LNGLPPPPQKGPRHPGLRRPNSNPDISVRVGFGKKFNYSKNDRYRFPKILAIWRALREHWGLQMKKRRKSTIKNWSKTIVVCLAPFRDSGTKTTITGLEKSGVE